MPPPPDRAYLSIIQWPDGATEDARTEAVVRATGADPFQARLAVRKGAPQVIAAIPAAAAPSAIKALRDAGAIAMAPTRSAMSALSPCLKAKRLAEGGTPGQGHAFAVEAWRGDGLSFRASELFLMVRASLRATVTRSRPDMGGENLLVKTVTYGPAVGSVAAAAAGFRESSDDASAPRTTRTTTTDILDLHLKDSRRVRISGDKFNFDILGTERGYTDRENIDRLALLIARNARHAIVDTSFDRFQCPSDVTRQHFHAVGDETVRRTNDLPAFEFYSIWACLVYRSMLASGVSG